MDSALGQTDNDNYRPVRRKGAFFTAPLLECLNTSDYTPPFEEQLVRLVQASKTKGFASRISVYFENLQNGQSYGLEENAYYSPASMMKVADMMYIYKLAELDPEILNGEIVIRKRRIPTLGDSKLEEGESYTVQRVISEMILESDNQAMFALQEHFQNEQLWAPVFRELGQEIDFRADNLKSLTPKSYSTLFKALYNSTYLNMEYSHMALEQLAATSFADGIVRGVNDTGIAVANKFGFREWSNSFQLHETAIVYLEDMPYIVSIMTEGKEPKNLRNVIESVSRTIHESCVKQRNTQRRIASEGVGTNLVQPLLECSIDSIKLLPTRKRLQEKVNSLLENDTLKDVSVFVMQLTGGNYMSINGNTLFRPGSLMRVPHMMALLKASERNPILLSQKFVFNRDTSLFKLSLGDQYLSPGKEYTMKQLIERMVIFSDADAADLIYSSSLNRANVWERLFTTLGIGHLWQDNRFTGEISTQEYATFLRTLYNSSFLNNRNSELCLEILSRSKFKLGIRKGIGMDDYTASKLGDLSYEENGETVVELHEAAIVYAEDNPYILCIMTKGLDFDGQSKVLEEISRFVYGEMSR